MDSACPGAARPQSPAADATSHCFLPPTPELGLHKDTLVRNTFSFWTESKCGGLEEPRMRAHCFCAGRTLRRRYRGAEPSRWVSPVHTTLENQRHPTSQGHTRIQSEAPTAGVRLLRVGCQALFPRWAGAPAAPCTVTPALKRSSHVDRKPRTAHTAGGNATRRPAV